MKPKPLFSTSRIHALDLMRGWFIIVIICDHLMRVPAVMDVFTGRGLLWVSAAEGFFFISGMLVGIVRGRQAEREGLGSAARHIWRRAGKLYAASIVLTLLTMAAGYTLAKNGITPPKGGLVYFNDLASMAYNVLNLNYTYGWADYLSFYAVFLALSPAVLWLLRKKLWWMVVWASLTLWLIKGLVHLPFLSYYALWQAYFFLGLVAGFHLDAITGFWRLMSAESRRIARTTIYGLTGVTIAASFAFTFGTPFFDGHVTVVPYLLRAFHLPPASVMYDYFFAFKENTAFKQLFQENRSGLLRLPLFLLWFSSLLLLVRRYEAAILRRAGWLLLPLGRNSLYVYIISSVVAFALPLAGLPVTWLVNSLLEIAVIAGCWLAVRRRFLFRIIPR